VEEVEEVDSVMASRQAEEVEWRDGITAG